MPSVLFITAIDVFFKLIYALIFIRCILSWLPLGRNPIVEFIYTLTDPILVPIRHLLDQSPIGGGMMLDFSPIIALFVMRIIQILLYSLVGL